MQYSFRMKNLLKYLIILTFIFGCSEKNENNKNEASTKVKGPKNAVELTATNTPGKLVAVLENSITSYYINKGYPRGFEYEMLNMFCKEYNLELEIKMVQNIDYILDSLILGNADLVAANLQITAGRKGKVSFTEPILRTRQVIIQRLPDNYRKLSKSQQNKRVITDALDLNHKTIHLHKNTSFIAQLNMFNTANGLEIKIVERDSEEGTDELISKISEGEIDYTILDENTAHIYKKIYPNLHISTPISLSHNIAWAVKKDNHNLLKLINDWQAKYKNGTKWNMIYNKYFTHTSREVRYIRDNFAQIKTGELSPYDPLIKKYANYINWDWRLLASLIRRESHFNRNAQSSFGAQGLMQVLPATAGQFGITPSQLSIPEYNIKAGTRFIQWLEQYWAEKLPPEADHDKFILASYNAGPGHVLDAMRLAEKYNLDPHVWDENVETMLFNKSKPKYYRDAVVRHGYCRGQEPVRYVKDILTYYEYYKAYTNENEEDVEKEMAAL